MILEIFQLIENRIESVNFTDLASKIKGKKLKKEDKLCEKDYIVCCIHYIIEKCTELNYPFARIQDKVYLYNGCYWLELNSFQIESFLSRACLKMGMDTISVKHFSFKEKLIKQFKSDVKRVVEVQRQEEVLINLQNGTFHISSEGFCRQDFKPENYLTYQLPFEYDNTSKAPLFNKYLNEVLPDEEKQNILAEYVGYIFARHLKLEKTLLLYGTGSNGKSVFFEVLQALLGRNNVSNFDLESLTDKQGYSRAEIANKLLNYSSEISKRLNQAKFKALVSGEPVEARSPYGKPFILYDYARLLFNCNMLPTDIEQTDAFFRRFLIVHFDVKITSEQKDIQLANKIIKNELSGVFNWVLRGLNRILTKNEFSYCESSEHLLHVYRQESDSVRLFLSDQDEGYLKTDKESINSSMKRFMPGESQNSDVVIENQKIKTLGLYDEYKSYCLERGLRPLSYPKFLKRIEASGVQTQKTRDGKVAFLTKRIDALKTQLEQHEMYKDIIENPEKYEKPLSIAERMKLNQYKR